MFNPYMGRVLIRLFGVNRGRERGSVVEFGNQRFGADGLIAGVDTVEGFYRALGFQFYTALDVNTEFGSMVYDLNFTLDRGDVHPIGTDRRMRGAFDLVTNNGTGEHIFNQAAVFQNAHDMCKPGGTMIHVMPFTPWLNHGFFTFQPVLYRDLALANNYSFQALFIGTREDQAEALPVEPDSWPFVEKRPRQLQDYVRNKLDRARSANSKYRDCFIAVVLGKRSRDPFIFPVQGKYKSALETKELRERYRV